MAKKKTEKLNKSEVIRKYLTEHPGVMPLQVADDLTQKHGEEFKVNLVNSVKGKMKQNSVLAAGAQPSSTASAPPAGSNNSRKLNKAATIAAYIQQHPAEPMADVAAELTKIHGQSFSVGYVKNIKGKMNTTGGGKRKGANRGRPKKVATSAAKPATPISAARDEAEITLEDLLAAKALVDKLGNARRALTAINSLKLFG